MHSNSIIEIDLKQGDVLSLFKLALEFAFKIHFGFNMSGTHQLLAYVDDVDLIGNDIRTIENAFHGAMGCGQKKLYARVVVPSTPVFFLAMAV